MQAKIFSYKVEGVVLEAQNEQLKLSKSFDRKQILEPIKEMLKAENFKVDETSLSFKIKDDQLFIEGLAVANEEPKSVGFRFGK